MNAGFSSLKRLKGQMLAASLVNSTAYDDKILAIGRGVAAQLESMCNRKFMRQVNAQEIFQPDRASYCLSRYPVEAITALDLMTDVDQGWQSLDLSLINTWNPLSGLIYMPDNTDGGPYYSQLRVTYTGGYWWDVTEDDSGVMPAGATSVPDDLVLAWQIQCRHIFRQTDILGATIAQDPEKQESEKKMELLDIVKSLVDCLIRYQLA